MAKMGSRKHLKRFKAPKSWPISPKENKWTVKPAAGPHAIEDSLSLLVVIRDILGLADNSREAKRIINTGKVLVDGRARKDYKYPVGFMDVVEIPTSEDFYRVLPDLKGRLTLHPISKENSGFKLCKITNKTTLKKGKTQLNLHDGRNVLVEDSFSASDVVSLAVPEQEITDNFKFEEGALVLITGGKHIGEIGKINEININKSSNPNTVVVENDKKENFLTLKDYAFVIGKDKPAISLPGGK
ncbi:SSU ribosomal protein S4E [Methanobrevibacter arboriphilus JCM 13429 = DSM 1125]|uniref:Small ribosomal subunit protein eS4 n=1 Tax=Methanobrevibacter arboriphilus JCM 13429 = DSM 1125 TaxID=1300164 RepID=A0A1V6N304_METAZ|nr:30S ribosomal protein S4e [Methanobrevibacter arboriphilus]OQD59088.1 SSU ribosomal protein S4E [Methanobrevibacter arboriphilus JCM 13429 = DSM 1125]